MTPDDIIRTALQVSASDTNVLLECPAGHRLELSLEAAEATGERLLLMAYELGSRGPLTGL